MSLLQMFGIGKCQPVYTAHTLPNLFTKETRLTSALQQYVDSYSLSDIDEHWFLLRDRYSGYEWAKSGVIKRFEDDANHLGNRVANIRDLGEAGSHKKLKKVEVFRTSTLNKFRNDEIDLDWPNARNSRKISFNDCEIDTAYIEISIQFKFLYIAGALKTENLKSYFSGLGVRSGK